MKMDKFYMPTLKEDPQDAEIASHKLLVRGGFIRKTASGLYSYLPLGYRVVRKIENIVREEMDNFGAQEIHTSVLQDKEIWEESDRWSNFGPEMFKVYDRNDRQFCLGPTAEENFTNLIKGEIKSYKQLPLNIYQIQNKYRDEKRPRFGINRSREFLMKDAYSFDVDEEGMREAYMNMWRAYKIIFNRLGVEYKIVEGDSGAMGGNASHEFIALSDVGEGVIYYSEDDQFAATDEKARVNYKVDDVDKEMKDPEKILTPNCKTIEDVSDFIEVDKAHCLKAVDLVVKGESIIVFIPGDRELNEAKLIAHLGCAEHEIEKMDENTITEIGSFPGYTGPIGLRDDVRLIADRRVSEMRNLVVGANEENHHIRNINYGRDFECELVDDLLMIKEGDTDANGKPLISNRGIEVGNIFQLGTKYSKALDAKFLDENGKEQFFQMGSYGIGVTRTVSAIVEQNHDEKGIIWPLVVCPYQAIVTIVNVKDSYQANLGERIYEKLLLEGIEVLLDNRKERAGIKFNDRDLIGIPLRITVGKKAGENIVEYSERKDMENFEMQAEDAIDKVLNVVSSSLRKSCKYE
ncbi:MAG: proline--tRNA ligase [Finegoldia sp.]|nr:proline--tRNA ligase [Finegoldia sp.]